MSTRAVRRVAAGVLLGSLTMLGVATLDAFAVATVPVLGSFATLPEPQAAEPETIELPPPPATPGTCLNWTRADAADTAVVDCAEPHLFEQSGTVALVDQAQLPDDQQFRQLVKERCNPVVVSYLDGKLDPSGRYRVGALKPSAARWEQGDRDLRCGLQSASRSGALYPMSGRVAENDQSAVQEPGVCLAIDGPTVGDPVDCAGLHSNEAVGIVDLGAQFPDAFPATADQDAFLQPECARIANEYAGGPEVISAKKLTVYWDNITEESWAAGTRRVNCSLGALLPDNSGFAPVTGSVRGDVLVGETVAPPATNTPEAGVPAPTTGPAEPTDGPPLEGPEPTGEVQPSTAPDAENPEGEADGPEQTQAPEPGPTTDAPAPLIPPVLDDVLPLPAT